MVYVCTCGLFIEAMGSTPKKMKGNELFPLTPTTPYKSPTTPSKSQEDFAGYVHHVSEVFKTSTEQYGFEFMFQENEESFKVATCWNASLFDEFKRLDASQHAVKFNAKREINSKYTDLSLSGNATCTQTNVDFAYCKYIDDSQTPLELLSLLDEDDTAVAKGMITKVDKIHPLFALVTIIATDGNMAELKVWGNLGENLEKGLVIKCVAKMRVYKGTMQSNVNSKLTILRHESTENYPKVPTEQENGKTQKVVKISGCNYISEYRCIKTKCGAILPSGPNGCFKEIGANNTKIAKCPTCNFSSPAWNMTCKLEIEDAFDNTYNVSGKLFKDFTNQELTQEQTDIFAAETKELCVILKEDEVIQIIKAN